MNTKSTAEKNVSANVTVGAIELLRNHFLRHNTTAKYACRVLHLDYKHYGATARVIKHRVKEMWGGVNVLGHSQNPQTHRQIWYLMGKVPDGEVLQAFLAASRGACNRGNAWYCSSNRNGQLNYRSKFLALRLLPSTRYLEVLCRDPSLDGLAIREKFELILYSTLQVLEEVMEYRSPHNCVELLTSKPLIRRIFLFFYVLFCTFKLFFN